MRKQRKLEHINLSLKTWGKTNTNGFEEILLVPQGLPELGLEDISLATSFLGKRVKAPILINAMTGGHAEVKEINRRLAKTARKFGIPMAIGSQKAALDDSEVTDTYTVIRDENPEGVILANINAGTKYDQALRAIEMIKADGLQLHLNVAQELAMAEGDRDFKGLLENIKDVVICSPVPIIVKEVGYGLTRETVLKLCQAGVKYVDIGGRGGTDFIMIEALRAGRKYEESGNIGISSAISLLETLSLELPLYVVASGGFKDGTSIAKALTLGADLVGIAGYFLQVLLQQSQDMLEQKITEMLAELRRTMLLTGACNLQELSQKSVVILGKTAEWLERRGVALNDYARRR